MNGVTFHYCTTDMNNGYGWYPGYFHVRLIFSLMATKTIFEQMKLIFYFYLFLFSKNGLCILGSE